MMEIVTLKMFFVKLHLKLCSYDEVTPGEGKKPESIALGSIVRNLHCHMICGNKKSSRTKNPNIFCKVFQSDNFEL